MPLTCLIHSDLNLADLKHKSRRICPGMLVAEREIWLTIARMLWAFNMTEVQGEPIDLNEYDGLSGRSPMPFRIHLTPRDAEVEKVLKREGAKWAGDVKA